MKITILGSLLLLSFVVLVKSQDDKGIEEVKKFIMDLIESADLDKAEKEALEKLLPLDGDKKKAAMDLVDRIKKAAKEEDDASKPKPDDKKPDDMKPDDKKPDDKKPDDKKPDDKKPDDKKPDDKKPDDKKPDDKKPDDKKPDDKKPDDKKPDDKKPDDKPDKKPEDKPDKKPEDKPDKKPEDKPDKKPEDKPDKKPDDKPDKKPEDKPTDEKDPVKTFVMIVKDIKTTTKKTFTSIRDLIKEGLKGKPRQPLIKKIINQLSDKDSKPDGKPVYILLDLSNGVSVSSNPDEIADKLKGGSKKSEKKKDEDDDDDSDDVIEELVSFFGLDE